MNKLTIKILPLLLTVFLISGCYHAKIVTGETASSEVHENKWAASWIGGLVPPEAINVEKECTNGVAKVETKHSFLNMFVGVLTGGIFTPMHLTVTCAEASSAFIPNVNIDAVSIPKYSSERDFVQAFQQAVDQSAETGNPVYVYY